jgi:diguanylate cyclase (GGDEF)-like protein
VNVARRNEILLGLIVPLALLVVLMILGLGSDEPGACLAFMATAPMLAATFSGVLVTGLVSLATLAVATVTAAVGYGKDFSDAIPILVGVIVITGVAVMASQSTTGHSRRRGAVGASARAPEPSRPSVAASTGVAGFDALTGLPTREGVLPTLSGPNRGGDHVVAFVGCDRFAAFNDDHGRDVGDVLLFAVAGRTRHALTDEDVVARWAGDEFLLVVDATSADPRETLQAIADKVNQNPIRTDMGLVPATVCVGAAFWPAGADFDDAIALARRAMHAAKSQGPGRVVMDGTVPSQGSG